MKYYLKRLLILAIMALPCRLLAQIDTTLKVGDTIPDVVLHNLINYKDSTVKLSDFKGKAIIIDFFASWCTPCLEKMPELQQWQTKYADNLQIISVAYENIGGIKRLLEQIKKSKGVDLITATETSPKLQNGRLLKFFPHTEVPYYILIDKDRVVRALNHFENMKEDNVVKLINGTKITNQHKDDSHQVLTKEDSIQKDKLSRNFMVSLVNGNEENVLKDFIECCIFTKTSYDIDGIHLFGQQAGFNTSKTSNPRPFKDRMIRANNWTPDMLYRLAFIHQIYPEPDHMEWPSSKRVIVEIKDTSKAKLFAPFSRELCYGYLRITKKEKSEPDLALIMQQDLDNFFGLKSKMERRIMPCYELVVKDTTLAKSKGGTPFSNDNLYGIKIINKPVERIAQLLRNYFENTHKEGSIIVNDTNWKAKIDIQLDCQMDNIIEVKQELVKHGFDLIKTNAEVNMIVITDGSEKVLR